MEQSKFNQLLTLESRILADRRSLNELSGQLRSHNSEYVQSKIAMLEEDIAYMSREIVNIKNEYVNPGYARPAIPAQPVQQDARPVMPAQPVQQDVRPSLPVSPARPISPYSEPVMLDQDRAANSPYPNSPYPNSPYPNSPYPNNPYANGPYGKNPYPNSPYVANGYQNKVNKNNDFERTFGKSFMGIAASVLIFISLILFATLLLPKLNDPAKMVIMYLVSAAFLGVGALRMYKDKENSFNIALTGCGLGALFISLLLSNIYFKMLGDIPLFILIAFWGVLVCVFAKNKNYVFQIIGEVGILIATIFGCILCVELGDGGRFLALLIFYIISSAIFYIVNFDTSFEENLCYHFFAMIGSVVLTVACLAFTGVNNLVCCVLAITIMLINIVAIMLHKVEGQTEIFGLVTCAHLFCVILTTAYLIDNDLITGIVCYVVGMVMLVIVNLKKYPNKNGLYILSVASIAIALIGLGTNGYAYDYGVVWLMIIPFLIYGFIKDSKFYKIVGGLLMAFYLVVFDYDMQLIHFLFMLAAFIVAYNCMFIFKKQYDKNYKDLLHIGALIFIAIEMNGALEEIFGSGDMAESVISLIVYICFFALNTICATTKFATNFATGQKEDNQEVYVIANIFAMIWGIARISAGGYDAFHFINILVGFAAFMFGTKNILDNKKEDVLLNIYVGIKFTVFLITVLLSFDAVNYIISSCCLLLAILLILIGFMGRYKYLRIYGLGLTMISIFKLIMIDMHYENTLGNAISFFVSGILCFAISMIYNYLDKLINKED